MAQTATKTGLSVTGHINNKVYETGRRVMADVKEQISIVFDDELPQWNYRILPR
jgi:hypothetical protein